MPLGRKSSATPEQVETIAYVALGLEPDERPLAWQERSLCAQTDPDAFFPKKGENSRQAKQVCKSCEVVAECLDQAIERGDYDFGIQGGKNPGERRKIARQRGLL